MAVWYAAQHATLHSTAQHTCVLQYNTTTGITHIPSILPAAIEGQLGTIWLEMSLITLLGLNN